MENQIILATKQLTKKYGDVKAVEQINLNVKKGRIYGFLGRKRLFNFFYSISPTQFLVMDQRHTETHTHTLEVRTQLSLYNLRLRPPS